MERWCWLAHGWTLDPTTGRARSGAAAFGATDLHVRVTSRGGVQDRNGHLGPFQAIWLGGGPAEPGVHPVARVTEDTVELAGGAAFENPSELDYGVPLAEMACVAEDVDRELARKRAVARLLAARLDRDTAAAVAARLRAAPPQPFRWVVRPCAHGPMLTMSRSCSAKTSALS